MGVYDTFGKCGAQIKAGPCAMEQYEIGDDVPLINGVYATYEGFIVIVGSKFVAEFDNLFDKWGGELSAKELLDSRNPLAGMIKSLEGVEDA